jgi:hypothetical protein
MNRTPFRIETQELTRWSGERLELKEPYGSWCRDNIGGIGFEIWFCHDWNRLRTTLYLASEEDLTLFRIRFPEVAE